MSIAAKSLLLLLNQEKPRAVPLIHCLILAVTATIRRKSQRTRCQRQACFGAFRDPSRDYDRDYLRRPHKNGGRCRVDAQ
jgi:hypothetical protein